MAASLDRHRQGGRRNVQPSGPGKSGAQRAEPSPEVARALEVARAARARAARIRTDTGGAPSRPQTPPRAQSHGAEPRAGVVEMPRPASTPVDRPAPQEPRAPVAARGPSPAPTVERPRFDRTMETLAAGGPAGWAAEIREPEPEDDRLAKLRRALPQLAFGTEDSGKEPVRRRRPVAGPGDDPTAAGDPPGADDDAGPASAPPTTPLERSEQSQPPGLPQASATAEPQSAVHHVDAARPADAGPALDPRALCTGDGAAPTADAGDVVFADPAVVSGVDQVTEAERRGVLPTLLRRGGDVVGKLMFRAMAATYGALRETAMFGVGIVAGVALLAGLSDERTGTLVRAAWLMEPQHRATVERTLTIAPAPLVTQAPDATAPDAGTTNARPVLLPPAPPRPEGPEASGTTEQADDGSTPPGAAAEPDPTLARLAGVVDNDPDRWDAVYELAHALDDRGDLEAAVPLYRRAARLNPEHPAVAYDFGYALQRQGEATAAIEQYRRALELDPDHAYALYNLGALLQREGDLVAATRHFERASELQPDNAFLFYQWGRALEERGDRAGAVARYRRAAEVGPNQQPGRDSLARIRALTSETGDAAPTG